MLEVRQAKLGLRLVLRFLRFHPKRNSKGGTPRRNPESFVSPLQGLQKASESHIPRVLPKLWQVPLTSGRQYCRRKRT